MEKNKRVPEKWQTYHTKNNEELTVQYYSEEKGYVTYYKQAKVYTCKLSWFVQKLRKEDMI